MQSDKNRSQDEPLEVLLSAIEHYEYCPRQCALIHLDDAYRENLYTQRGNLAHQRVDSGESGLADDIEIKRDIPLWSHTLAIRGKSDLVEFRPEGPYPVEYKAGKRSSRASDMQLCAQALCLEEMTGQPVPTGAVFQYGARQRREVRIDEQLRRQTRQVIKSIRTMLEKATLPEPVNDARCKNCSLIDVCMPDVVTDTNRQRGLQAALWTIQTEPDAETES